VKQNNPMKFRFINHDMNRIWDDSYVEGSYEYLRREELKKLLEPADIVFDIHSVSK
jgi:succinylglutamate desuccinylase